MCVLLPIFHLVLIQSQAFRCFLIWDVLCLFRLHFFFQFFVLFVVVVRSIMTLHSSNDASRCSWSGCCSHSTRQYRSCRRYFNTNLNVIIHNLSNFRIREFLRYSKLQLPSELLIHCWDVPVLVSALKQFDPQLDFLEVFNSLDCDDFLLSSSQSFAFLHQIWTEASLEGMIGSIVCKPWTHQRMRIRIIWC